MLPEEKRPVGSSSLTWVTIAASIGTFCDFYDFNIASVASALAWPTVFFAFTNAAFATALSIATFGVSYLARPVGALIFGHYGDKIGRKRMLVWTLILGGFSTLAIGLLPSYASIGISAAILVILFRIFFGIALGGEYGGATSWVREHAASKDSKHSGFLTGVSIGISQSGNAIALGSFSIILALVNHSFFLSWGWRIPFFVGFVVFVVGIVMRRRTAESPLFLAEAKENKQSRSPLKETIKKYWKVMIPLMCVGAGFQGSVVSAMQSTYSVSYAVAKGLTATDTTALLAVAAFIGMFSAFNSSYLTDKFGRKAMGRISPIYVLIWLVPFFLVLSHPSVILFFVAEAVLYCGHNIGYGASPALFSEQFPTQYRYTGTGLSYGLSSFLAGLVVTFVYPAIIATSKSILTSIWYIALALACCQIIAFIGYMFVKETKGRDVTVAS